MAITRRAIVAGLALGPVVAGGGRVRAGTTGDGPIARTIVVARTGTRAPDEPELRYGEAPFPEPVRFRTRAPARLRIENHLDEATNVDLHGLRIASGVAGVGGTASRPIPPGGVLEIPFTPPDAGTFWLHAGSLPDIADQTVRGLAAALIVDDADPADMDRDLLVLLTERAAPVPGDAFPGPRDAAGSMRVNGRVWPDEVRLPPGSRARLRVVNASTSRALGLSCEGARPFVVAIDGQPSELFEPLRDAVPVGPGARFDLVVDLPAAPGAVVTLLVKTSDATPGERGAPAYVMRTEGAPRPIRAALAALAPNSLLPRVIPLEASTRATLVAEAHASTMKDGGQAWSVNGAVLAPGGLTSKPLFRVRRGTPVTLAFRNAAPVLAAFRLHGHAMRLLHPLDDGWEPYWRDSVLVAPGTTQHAAFLADNPGAWLIDSAFARQAAAGLRTWFEVV